MVAQLTYGAKPPVAVPGMIAEHFSLRQIDSWLAGGDIPFGMAVVVSGTDPRQVLVADSPNSAFVGISVFAQQLNVNAIDVGGCEYKQFDQVPVMARGRIWVKAAGAVDAQDPAYALPDGSGQFTNVNVGSVNVNIGGKFMTSATAADELVEIEFGF